MSAAFIVQPAISDLANSPDIIPHVSLSTLHSCKISGIFPVVFFVFASHQLGRGLSHYAGGVFSGSPLTLAAAALCAMLPTGLQALGATILFTAFDVMSALLLRVMCRRAVEVESCDW